MDGNGGGDRPHAVVFPFPSLGHIIPMMHLSCRLEALGFLITFVNTEHNHLRILHAWRARRIPLPQEHEVHINMVGLPDANMPSLETINVFEAIMSTDRLRGAFERLIGKLVESQGCPPVCIIADGFLSWTQDIAQDFSLQWAVFWASSTATSLISTHIPDLMERGLAPLKAENEHSYISFIDGMPTISSSDLPTSIARQDRYDPGFRHRIERIQRVKRADWIFANTFMALEHNELRAMQGRVQNKLLPVGPVLSLGFLEISDGTADIEITIDDSVEDDRCIDWLDRQGALSVVYVSFGSIAHLSGRQLEQVAQGLKACSYPFLWVIRNELVQTMSADVRNAFTEKVRGRSLVIPSAPARVLKHPSLGAFVTHCGWNSTLEGISVGLPMLCWPCFADQMLNCRYIVKEWRIGIEFAKAATGLVDKSEVERVVRAVLEGDQGRQIRRRIRSLRDAARTALMAGGLSRKSLEEFAEAMKSEMRSSFFF
ncbi:UDP-glycosyltransferase 85A1 isoform X2 [Selaginella moellendorffii]|nr:UDP-glycosyltransferase 85A1 isoform X2 [Selaginella moellendorffii]|eukprot:XP_024532147.1 UDP-glycosyltransferase 85A1 isoform X2 [Selaginella moellendorffii]